MATNKNNLVDPEGPKSLDVHKLALSRELLDDIELSRLGNEQLLLKASRLARLVDEPETRQWLAFELNGYQNTPEARRYMDAFNRWSDRSASQGYWQAFASLGAWADAMRSEIQQLRVPDVSVSISSANPNEWVTGRGYYDASKVPDVSAASSGVMTRMQSCTRTIAQLREIQARIIAAVHDFAVRTYYRFAFSGASESIFRQHQVEIDHLLRRDARDVIEKIPSITARLGEGDREAVSQALNSCRRMIKAFADAVQPPEDREVEEGGATYQIGNDKVLNRIQYCLSQTCSSGGRRDRLNRNLRLLWDRCSAGSHADVTPDEARDVFLQTYLTLGEILRARGSSSSPGPTKTGAQPAVAPADPAAGTPKSHRGAGNVRRARR
jgi:hypothetical protein